MSNLQLPTTTITPPHLPSSYHQIYHPACVSPSPPPSSQSSPSSSPSPPPTLATSPSVESTDLTTNTCTRRTTAGDTISVHYRGTLLSTGAEFDASYNRNQPLTFTVGQGQVIKGWDEGLLEMCVGDKRKLVIPPEFGYGERGMGPIPGGSTLVFETEVVGIEGVGSEGVGDGEGEGEGMHVGDEL
ncbi:Peptidyl-prolyl cis-trans isomerase fpr2 [Lecanora helva]